MNKARFEAFSDGVFAFAITLLVLGFVVPHLARPDARQLAQSLLAMWPNLIAYALSFAVIGIMWQNHHTLFRTVARVDRTTIFYNLLLLAGTAFIPFATGTLGAYPTLLPATLLYGIVLTYCSTVYNVMLSHIIRSRSIDASISPETIRHTVRSYRFGWVTYAIATLIGFVSPVASFAAFVLIVGYYLVPHGVDADIETTAA
ncbi:MAG TPA: TMEM175 family protein [Candidatus Tumulicola sp.]